MSALRRSTCNACTGSLFSGAWTQGLLFACWEGAEEHAAARRIGEAEQEGGQQERASRQRKAQT
mgnify:CR=1 FL=1